MFALAAGCADKWEGGRVVVLGFDGMDHALTRRLMDEGRLPHLSRLAARGGFSPLQTSMPPQSPVAWSNFITGTDPGGHGIFDFIHRDPATLLPFLSTSRTVEAKKLRIGAWRIPLGADRVELLRRGRPFWEALSERGVPTTIVRMPANFPPSGTATRELSGMGTPDILGGYGTFSFFTSDPSPWAGRPIGGGRIHSADVVDGVVRGALLGPRNPFVVEERSARAEFSVHLDPDLAAAKLVVGDEQRLLTQGAWSDWVPVDLDLMPMQSVPAMARFYLKQVRPTFALYVTPLNLDPMNSLMPISTPGSFAEDLAAKGGRYYTQGMPEDTKAYEADVLSTEEFLAQAGIAHDEIARQYRRVLAGFDGGLLFYYFGNGDQISHMIWRSMDPGHPGYRPADAALADRVPTIYEEFDAIVGATVAALGPDDLLVVMSDHGFTSWRRSFHLNTWLEERGYLHLLPGASPDPKGPFSGVDWSKTRAYALGLNGLYVNLLGRERRGIVPLASKDALVAEISAALEATVDPATGAPAVTRVDRREEYRGRGHAEVGPDLVVGYAKGTRGSNESALGGLMPEVFSDNLSRWSGDHCMDPDAVPGVLFTSRKLKKPAARLEDLAGAILAEFGVEFGSRN
jgi:predicted AlkP superfamily phosphohydrolase/phosphomutase